MTDREQNDQCGAIKKELEECKNSFRPAEFRLVLWMLLSLTILVVLLIVLPFIARNESNSSDFVEYGKWILPALLGAFGAWIGAGAAYYFGKENLKLSSDSTKEALEIQGKTSKYHADNATIINIKPTPLNPNFKFNMDSKLSEVKEELNKNVDYWFIPILEDNKMKDVIHVEAFWRFYMNDEVDENNTLEELLKHIEVNEIIKLKLSKLHGFFKVFKIDDNVCDSLELMNYYDVSLGIVCDSRGYATHCFTRRDLKTFMLGIRTDDAKTARLL